MPCHETIQIAMTAAISGRCQGAKQLWHHLRGYPEPVCPLDFGETQGAIGGE